MNESTAVKALAALAQETRLKLFRLLVVAGKDGLTPGQMTETLKVLPTALSFHLKELNYAGLISAERDGRNIIYRADYAAMDDLLAFLTKECCQGQPCLVTTTPACSECEEPQESTR